MFWRPYGDSILPDQRVTFREEMATAWVPPEHVAKYGLLLRPHISTGAGRPKESWNTNNEWESPAITTVSRRVRLMSQSAVPNSDVATGLWTPTPVYPQIRQLLTGDPNFVTSSQDPTSDTFIVKLSGVAWPAAGPEVLKIRLQNTTSSLVIATISLFDGSTLIGTWTVQPPMGFTTYSCP